MLEFKDATHNYSEIWKKRPERMEADSVMGNI